MAKVHDLLETLQDSQYVCAAQRKCHIENNLITAVGYISDTEEIIKASLSLFQHDCVAAFELSEV